MSTVIYNSYNSSMITNPIDLINDPIYIILMKSSYSPVVSAESTYSDIALGEISETTGYNTSGIPLENPILSADGDRSVYLADDSVWNDSEITAKGAVIYKKTGDSETSQLIGYYDFIVNFSSKDGIFKVKHNRNDGILNFKQSS